MVYMTHTKTAAKKKAEKMRKMGYNSTVYKLKGGKWGITAKRK